MPSWWVNFIAQFSQLRWKLTWSYFTVTVAALIVAELVVIVGISAYFFNKTRQTPESLLLEIMSGSYIQLGRKYLSANPPDTDGLGELLGQFTATVADITPIEIGNFVLDIASTNILYVIYTDAEGRLIDSVPHDFIQNTKSGDWLDTSEIPGLEDPFEAALVGKNQSQNLIQRVADDTITGAIPIYHNNEPEEIVGVLAFMHKSQYREILRSQQFARQIGISLVFITLIAGIFSTVFGFFTARGLTARLDNLGRSAKAWSQGDFAVFFDDSNPDELGQLSNTLNHMATQLENLLNERQEISIIEERNRLARDLHDSVKQQAFAASAQIAAGLARMKPKSSSAQEHLQEAEKLVYEVRRELTDLIQELHPAALDVDGLVSTIQKYARENENLIGIPIRVSVQGERSLSREIERSLFRIIQGALANIARHSKASEANIKLEYFSDSIRLTICDDGVGFDINEYRIGLGLRSMRERTELLNGILTLDSSPGEGTRISIQCPT
jgi:two-component system, NarL family, sensor histidine kinase LiaS